MADIDYSSVYVDWTDPLVSLDGVNTPAQLRMQLFIRMDNLSALEFNDDTLARVKLHYDKLTDAINSWIQVKSIKLSDSQKQKLSGWLEFLKDKYVLLSSEIPSVVKGYNKESKDPLVKAHRPFKLTEVIDVRIVVNTQLVPTLAECFIYVDQFNDLETTEWVYPQKHMFRRRETIVSHLYRLSL